ncbi:MAG: HPF/RaiA family ribosome-associated protein [Chitinophagaceae bacterium]|jgi:ribosome-associated translation inhibitor RaiA|nr:HPF/RaiA family ribosome-associated protein [Chitinophagaceae bacterium]MBK7679514.1 HPF/RaiA family ribosome-associated protein [Chitinophagaceae bacterium]MBK8299138.1 HPF/RaiA family ribosome-associated protein [Chitinophagaceae bacterium]MBK9659681.1 HPF/RaiA family ribosome-associated protein [Chitinophagaceae bacterium]MBL0068219.1 HPF/RaiA family ribosome-associated protein [Chitinophagaceae bacterium]
MTIQLNADKNLTIHEAFGNKLKDMLNDELSRFSESITRIEVHLSDENGPKKGLNDKRCLLEARLERRQPIAVTEFSDTHENAVIGAIDKLKASLTTKLGRLKNH